MRKGPRATSLSVRLVAGALVWLSVLLALGGGVLALAFRDAVQQEYASRLDAVLLGMIAAAEVSPNGSVVPARPLGDPRFDQIYSGLYWEVSGPGDKTIRSRSLWDSALAPSPGGKELQIRRLVGPKGENLLVVERDLEFPGAAGPVHMIVAGDLQEVSAGVRRFDRLLMTALGLLGLGMAVAVVIQVRFGLRPLRAMAVDLRAVRNGDRPRLPDHYPREVAPLADAMNGVLDKDAELIERARTHVGNLAHGLKTPLAVVAAEMSGKADRDVVSEQIRIMGRLIEHHLGRASAVAGAGRVLGLKTSVREVAGAITAVLSRVFSDRHLLFSVDIAETVSFHGHREDLEEILGNLLENAGKWAASQVRVTAGEDAGGLRLSVEDDGPGIPPDAVAEATRRGARLDEKGPGWGLGLSIVADLVEVNGGHLDFGRSDLGGLRVTVTLPRTA